MADLDAAHMPAQPFDRVECTVLGGFTTGYTPSRKDTHKLGYGVMPSVVCFLVKID